ncbi:nucleotidyltransferase [Deferribacterales bacterium RsTz2092]|nr:nucleotidyltransferase [Deferribacterales bacterium]
MLSIETIQDNINQLVGKYNVKRIHLFGSYANGNATDSSDVDLLVEFNIAVPSIFAVLGFREELQNRLQHDVDVVSLPLVNPSALQYRQDNKRL